MYIEYILVQRIIFYVTIYMYNILMDITGGGFFFKQIDIINKCERKRSKLVNHFLRSVRVI